MPIFGKCRSVFMRNKEKDAAQMAIKRRDFLAKAYELFTKKNIESGNPGRRNTFHEEIWSPCDLNKIAQGVSNKNLD